jgi:hypothetical protein
MPDGILSQQQHTVSISRMAVEQKNQLVVVRAAFSGRRHGNRQHSTSTRFVFDAK